MTCEFVHLHVHTEYSMVDGLARIKPLATAVRKAGMPAIAITDHCNLFGMVKFYRAALNEGIKPIIGVDLYVANDNDSSTLSRLILLCQSNEGYKNITRLVSKSYLEGQHLGKPIVQMTWIEEFSRGLIALSGGREGNIGQALLANDRLLAQKRLKTWMTLFPKRFYIELQRTGRENEEDYNGMAVALAEELQIPVVATNDVRFIEPDDFEAHEARVCIHEGFVLSDPKRPRRYNQQQYLRTAQEMVALFSDVPEAVANTVEIAKRCNLTLDFGQAYFPQFPVPEGMTIDSYFEAESWKGLEQRLARMFDPTSEQFLQLRKPYDERLGMELNVIKKMGFAGYFLIVADFIRWAKHNQIPVGPGRGSGPGSLVAYALEITDLDPLTFDLLFERFLNPERVSMPDFDVDFCMQGRDRVIEYVASCYGRESVSQIITYGSMAARAVVRDVGRVLGHPYTYVDQLAKLIPFELGMTLLKALQQDDTLLKRYQEEEEVKALIDLAIKLEGIPRNAGKHAGGVVIAPSLLTDFAPLYCEPGGNHLVTQFDKDDIEAVGLVKFDFLGLRTLTIIDWALQTINAKQPSSPIDISSIPLDDEKTYTLLRTSNTTAVFQLESRGMRDLIKRLQPTGFDDIVPLVALFRPGPLQSGMVDDFLNRRHGRAKVEYPHPTLEPILRPTYGVILYQEQVMQIAQVLAGYTLGSADLLRRAMGKKKPEEMAKHRAIFVNGAVTRGIDAPLANQIFDLMEKFAGYGFNKSHSASYALLSYQTAWLKAHFPAEYMSAVLSADMDHTDKVVRLIEECKRLGLHLTPPDINQGHYKFTVREDNSIVYGLGAIKGVGEAAVENLFECRHQQGMFKDLFDFCCRVDTRKVNRRVIESLIRSGAMDSLGVHRASLIASLDSALAAAEQKQRNQERGQHDLFGLSEEVEKNEVHYVSVEPWDDKTRLLGEKETLGLYLTGHPITEYESELSRFAIRLEDLKPTTKEKTSIIAGLVFSVRVVTTKSGNRMAVLALDDRTARIDAVIFSDLYNECRSLLLKDQLLVIEGEVSVDEFTESYRITARRVMSLEQARSNYAKRLLLNIEKSSANKNLFEYLQNALTPFRGGHCPVWVRYQSNEGRVELAFGSEWHIQLHQPLIDQLRQLCGQNAVVVDY